MNNAIKNIWAVICYPLIYMGVQLVISFIYIFALTFTVIIKILISGENIRLDGIEELLLSHADLKIPLAISAAAAFVIIFLILRKEWKSERFLGVSGIRIPPVLLCAALGIALNILIMCVFSVISVPQAKDSPVEEMIGDNLIFEIITIALMVPFLEEIIFRGIVLKRLTRITRRHTAVFLQGVVFGLIHFNLDFINPNVDQVLYAFILGIIIGYIYIWFGSVWYAVSVHGAFNLTPIILIRIFGSDEINLLWFLAVSFVVFIVSAVSLSVLAERGKKDGHITGVGFKNN